MSPAGVEPATYRLGGGRVHSFISPHKPKLRSFALVEVLSSHFKSLTPEQGATRSFGFCVTLVTGGKP